MVIVKNLTMDTPEYMLYVCNHIPVILAALLYMREYSLIKSFINVGVVIQAGWMVDLLGKLIFNHYVFSSTVYIFNSYSPFGHSVSIALHATTLIPSFFITYKKDSDKRTVPFSILYLAIIYILTLTLSEPGLDINCVFNMCNIPILSSIGTVNTFIPVVFFSIILPTHLIQKSIFLISSKRKM